MYINNFNIVLDMDRSQWPRSLRHEMYSITGIVGSNPTQSMDVCVYSVFVLSFVGSGLAKG
jgi:hypothetical protein